MNPKRLIQVFNNHELGLQERLFRLLVTIGLMGLAMGILVGLVLGESMANTLSLLVVFALAVAITYFSIHFHKIQIGAVLISVLLIYFALPFNFLTSGGIYGGGPIWLMFGVVFACLVVEKKAKYILIASSFCLYGVCYLIAYLNPQIMGSHTIHAAYADSFFTLAAVTGLVCSMILFQNAMYRKENKIAKEQKKEIEELNRMQNHFFSSMSHEIRTPINTIIGLNEMILREEISDEAAGDAKSIQGASKMLLTLINDILDMSKIESGKMQIVPAVYETGDMLSDVVNMLWIRAKEKGLEFHINVDPLLPSQLFGDEVRIKQILINVLNNAVKYTKEGAVTLSIQCKEQENGNALISYSVTDTGMGIKKESIPYLFQAFKRIDESENRYIEGTGLGLSIVKQLVELMGGDISVNSVYTKGSTFIITIPQKVVSNEEIGELDLETRHGTNQRESYKQSFVAEKARVLIVDDNEDIREVLGTYVAKEGFEPVVAKDGFEALDLFKKANPAVVLLDVMMPGMDGYKVCEKIREQSDVPIILVTAKGDYYDRVMGLDIGADDYIVKPFNGDEVMARVRAVLRRMGRSESTEEKKILNISDLTVNIETYTVYVGAEKLPMTKKEVETMWILAGNPSKVFTRDNLLDSLWGQDYFGDSRTVDSHIKRLRAKLDKVPHPNWEIKTIWGLGYKFELTV